MPPSLLHCTNGLNKGRNGMDSPKINSKILRTQQDYNPKHTWKCLWKQKTADTFTLKGNSFLISDP